jgi:nucleotide-binding universal stress UspA family protein
MTPKDLVVFLEERQECSARLAYAAALARHWQAHLIVTYVIRPLALDPHAGFAIGTALSEMLAEHETASRASLERARAAFDSLTDRRSFTSEWRTSRGEIGEALMLHARHASLAVMGAPDWQHREISVLGLSEQMILASGTPCLLLPDDWPAERLPRRIVVGWNGGREASRAIANAMPLLVAAESVHLVVVPEPKTRLLHGADPGADMATHLARQGAPVTLEQCGGAEAGAVLLERCAAIDADLLAMGAMGRPRISEVVFGGATRTVLENTRLPVLLSS